MKGGLARLLVISLLLAVITPLLTPQPAAHALSASEFHAGRIMDDGIFFDTGNFSQNDIQSFLNSKVPSCDTYGQKTIYDSSYNDTVTRATYSQRRGISPPFTCLRDYSVTTNNEAAENGLCNGYTVATQSAAQIIYGVAQSCGINPRVLITLLQKEQFLVTDDWPWPVQYQKATGYACPDTAACDANYYGFFNQVYNAAHQFKRYTANPSNYNYVPGINNYILYNPVTSCGGSNVYLENQATANLYNYTPYQPNQAALNNLYGTGDSCSSYGNRNFWQIYNNWFGATILPTVFKSSYDSTVYVLMSGYKIKIPSMAMLQDYGFDPYAIQSLAQSNVDATPSPSTDTGISTSLSYLVKSPSDQDSDGGTVYLVTIGKRYTISSMDQFSAFGFQTTNIAYLPLNNILAIRSGGNLANYVNTPSHSAFQISGGNKRIIFSYDTYKKLNPSDANTPVSDFVASLITSGNPISNSPILVRKSNGAVYLFLNNLYYLLPNQATYSCWGFKNTLSTPLYYLARDDYISTPQPIESLGCAIDVNSTVFLLNNINRVSYPSEFGPIAATKTPDLITLAQKLPAANEPLKQLVKSNTSPGVWYLEKSTRRSVPTYADLQLLGYNGNNITTIDQSALTTLPVGSIKLGSGLVVKASDSATVYVINNDQRIAFRSGDDFIAHGYAWSDIETYSSSVLDTAYPAAVSTVSPYMYRISNDVVYLVDRYSCFILDDTAQTAFGITKTAVQSQQIYNADIFYPLSYADCTTANLFVKSPSQGVVYWIDGGKKHPFSTWSAFVAKAGQNAKISILSDSTLSLLPSGSTL